MVSTVLAADNSHNPRTQRQKNPPNNPQTCAIRGAAKKKSAINPHN
ncbi:MAG: hypothetical protein HC817_13415, partial [Saprospiraceae bacterium]|nr:hypothetical protein [Saprospiraceae bacterium]